MPPPLFIILQFPFTQLAYVLFPVAVANGIISGSFTFCKSSPLLSKSCAVNLLIFMQILSTTACIMRKGITLISICTLKWDVIRLHHTKLPQYMKEMKKYHLAHHYKNFELGYGVTSERFHDINAVNIQAQPFFFHRQNLGFCIQYSPSGMILTNLTLFSVATLISPFFCLIFLPSERA